MTVLARRPGVELRGRHSECQALDRLLEGARTGRSSVLELRGTAGVGKTALLTYLLGKASGCRITRATGVESEMELAFAGLHQLCAPLLGSLDHLPSPQRDALRVAFGHAEGGAPDRFLVGLAVLSLFAEAAEKQPLVCLVDDVQWIDRASVQALAFVARRLLAERIVLVFTAREPSDERELVGLPVLMVEALGDSDAQVLLASVISGRLDEQVRDRIVAEAHGNPLALMELPRGLTSTELAGGFGVPEARLLESGIEASFLRRLRALPSETQRLLLTAAAEPVGDVSLLRRAAERLGIGADAAAAAETEGLLELGDRVRFRHPLVRSAVYRAAPLGARQAVHRALAEATDPEVDPDRRAWHRAHATSGPDEAVADELERSADRAQARGGLAAAGAFLEQAVRLTLEPAHRAERALLAAQAKHLSGASDAVLDLLATAAAGPLDELQQARLDLLRAQIAFASSRGRDAPPLLLNAAKRLELLDVTLARETYLEALSAAMFAGRLASGGGVLEACKAARAAHPASQPPHAREVLLDGLATRFALGYAAGAPMLKQALSAFRSNKIARADEIRWLWLAGWAAMDLWDHETSVVLSTRNVQLVRDAGALTALPIALSLRIYVHLHAGELAPAVFLIEEVEAVNSATGSHLAPYGALALAAMQGREAEAAELIDATVKEVVPRGEGFGLTVTEWARALLYNGLGRYEDALTAAGQAREHPDELSASTWALPELIEAAARSGNAGRASDALQRLSETTRASGTNWALGIEARSQALLSEGEAAESLYREAIEWLGRTPVRVDLARAHLLYGEWLRREDRRLDARDQLRRAHDMFSDMGVAGFAERARGELAATGETVRKRNVETFGLLTAQESQIARLATEGRTNAEIAARLFISARTVEWHLGHVFSKLDISSRTELRKVLPEPN